MANPIVGELAIASHPRNSLAKPGSFARPRATRQSGEAAVDDITSHEAVKQFKWVGTRPVRPDGVPKVTGLAQYGSGLAKAGMVVSHILASAHHECPIAFICIVPAAP